jgi:hypothetical protein
VPASPYWLAGPLWDEFAALARIARQDYDRIVGLVLDEIAVDGCITKSPGGGEVAGPSPVDRRKQGMKRSVLVEGYGMPLGRVRAGAQRHDSPAAGAHPGPARRSRPATRRDHRAPGCRLRLGA